MDKLLLLTNRELEVAELLAWGASKKEIPYLLINKSKNDRLISVHTVENITRSIFKKLEIQKVSELCSIYFCTRFNISMDISPLKRYSLTIIFIVLLTPQLFSHSNDLLRPQRSSCRVVRTARTRGSKRNESACYFNL